VAEALKASVEENLSKAWVRTGASEMDNLDDD